ncbi:stage II sporulation protein P [Haloimpatiens sp. FM7330]|uniref:stage II sporulation protein P n=1 Tax=Haloimpatiens sp. FM7330 TaxID=3298610 RepID=UPI003638745D
MKKSYKNIVITFLILGTAAGCTYAVVKNKETTTSTSYQKSVSISKSVNDSSNISNKTVEKASTDTKKSTIPFSSEIVVYNSHANEDYTSGMKVTNVGSIINDKLIKKGLKSNFIQCKPSKEYIKSYDSARNLITEKIENYSDKILLDVQRDTVENPKSSAKKIVIVLAKNNPHYKENKKFANLLIKELEKSQQVKACIFEYKNVRSYFNQDLSNKSILIELGNNKSSDNDVEECVNALVSALENVESSEV